MLDEEHMLQNGFRTSGLYPFDADAVHYNLLRKKGKKKGSSKDKTENRDETSSSTCSVEKKQFFHSFEKSLPVKKLQDFKLAETSKIWTGDCEDKGLFNYWLSLKKECQKGTILYWVDDFF